MRTVDDIVALAGGRTVVAEAAQITADAVRKWSENGEIPERHWAVIISLTNGVVTIDELYAMNQRARNGKAA